MKLAEELSLGFLSGSFLYDIYYDIQERDADEDASILFLGIDQCDFKYINAIGVINVGTNINCDVMGVNSFVDYYTYAPFVTLDFVYFMGCSGYSLIYSNERSVQTLKITNTYYSSCTLLLVL